MRPSALVAVLIVVGIPTVGAAAGGGLTLAGPGYVTTAEPTSAPLLLTLTLQDVACVRDVEVLVDLSIVQATRARAELAPERVAFRVASHSTLARAWTGEARTSILLEPLDASGLVEVLARYQLPSGCTALRGAAASGEARHAIRVEQPSAPPPTGPLPAVGVFESTQAAAPTTPIGLQAAIFATFLGGVAVVVKRLRKRAP